MLQVCTSTFKFNFVSTFQSASKSTPRDCEAEWRGAACMACVYSTLLTSTNRYRILWTPQPKNAFSISSPDLRELLWTPTVFSGLLVCIVQSFVVFLSTVTLCVHRACPCQRRSPFLSAHFIPFSTARFANISLQASPTFRRSQRGHNMEVWASIDVVLLLGRAQMSTKKIYIKKLFL